MSFTERVNDVTTDKESGFSLLEMVVAMGILIVLTVGGVLAYNGITQNAKEGATLAAAKSVHTAAIAYSVDNDGSTDPEDAANEYNATQSNDDGKSTLTAKINELYDGSLCTVATYGEDEILEVVGAGSVDECVEGGGGPKGTVFNSTTGWSGWSSVIDVNWCLSIYTNAPKNSLQVGRYQNSGSTDYHCGVRTTIDTVPGQKYEIVTQSKIDMNRPGTPHLRIYTNSDGDPGTTTAREMIDPSKAIDSIDRHTFTASRDMTEVTLYLPKTGLYIYDRQNRAFTSVSITPLR